MKNKFYFVLSITLLVGLIAIPLSCKKKPFDDLTVSVNTDVFTAPTAILFENAKAGATKQPGDFTMTVSGQDADKVLSVLATKTYKVQNGYIFLNMAQGLNPTPENPIVFKISGTAPGFESFTKDIIITSKEEQKFNVKMIETGNLPAGMVEHKTEVTLSSGTFTSNEIIETVGDANTSNTAKMEIQAGTTMKDKNGTVLTGGKVSVKVNYFDPRTEAVEVFPGGLTPQDVLDSTGKKIEGGVQFISAGLMQIEMKVGSSTVAEFSKPVAAEMVLDEKQENPMTGEKLVEGDKIPLWSRNDETGQWKHEGDAIVVSKNGALVAEFEMNHLSSWNLDFFYGTTTSKKLDIVFDADWVTSTGDCSVYMYAKDGSYIAGSYQGGIKNGDINTMDNTPNVASVYLVITDWNSGKSITTENFDPQTKGTIHVDVNSFNETGLVTIALKYNVKCTKNKIKPNSGTFITLTDLVTNRRTIYRLPAITSALTTDNLKVRLRNNRSYKVETVGLDGSVISYESLLNTANLTYTNLKGFTVDKLIYNSTSNTVEAEVTYVTNKC